MSWADIENGISDAVDGIWAEPFEFRPMAQTDVNGRAVADPGRAVKEVEVIWSGPSARLPDLGARDMPSGFVGRAKMSVTSPSLSADLRQFALGANPVKGDHFMRVGTGEVFVATDIKPDGQGRVVVPLAEVPQ